MPAHSYMFADLVGCAAAACLFPLFVALPGYSLAWLSGLFQFRRRTFAFQLACSVPTSIALCPAITYFAARFGSMAVWTMYGVLCVTAAAIATRRRLSLAPYTRTVSLLTAAWFVIGTFSLIDLQVGDRVWYPSAAFDYAVRTQFIHEIAIHGIPPSNPFFFPGHAVPLRYHYLWLQLCALVDQIGGSFVTARHAWIAGALWSGLGLMATVALYFRVFYYRGPLTFRRRALAGILLLGVTGLDIIPQAILWTLQLAGMRAIRPSLEWWNEQVDGFLYSTLWESHYVAGLVACLMAFLILWDASAQTMMRARVLRGVLAGTALATAFGSGIYVALVFGVFLALWTVWELARGLWREAATLAIAGAVAVVAALPMALALRGPAQGGSLLTLWMRPFSPIDGLLRGMGLDKGFTLPLANALALPLNYFLELGVFFVAAMIWFRARRTNRIPASPKVSMRAESALWLMIGVSVAICTFLRSSVIGNNDLGWRGFLVAQFALLLVTVDVLLGTPRRSASLTLLLLLGAAGSVYEIGINRFFAPLADRGVVPLFWWLAPDQRSGERNAAYRAAGEWIASATPPNAIVQFNPRIPVQNTSALLYSERPALAADFQCIATFGGDPALCPATLTAMNAVFPPTGQSAAADLAGVCRSLPVAIVVAGDTDRPWRDPQSWVWRQAPSFANSYVRVFRCR